MRTKSRNFTRGVEVRQRPCRPHAGQASRLTVLSTLEFWTWIAQAAIAEASHDRRSRTQAADLVGTPGTRAREHGVRLVAVRVRVGADVPLIVDCADRLCTVVGATSKRAKCQEARVNSTIDHDRRGTTWVHATVG